MLAPKHPQPVARRRAIPEMIVTVKQVDRIEPGHVIEVPPPAPAPGPRPPGDEA